MFANDAISILREEEGVRIFVSNVIKIIIVGLGGTNDVLRWNRSWIEWWNCGIE